MSNQKNINVDNLDYYHQKSVSGNDSRYIEKTKIGNGLKLGEDGTLSVNATGLTVDDTLSNTSENAIQNKAVNTALESKADKTEIPTSLPANGGNADTAGTAAACTGNSATATKLATARNINGMSFDGSANRINYGTCSTAAATAAKVVACTGFGLVTGAEITVKFTVTNTAASPTLNVNSTGAKAIYYRGAAISAGYLAANQTYTFRYNGTQYELVGDLNTNTTYSAASATAAGLVSTAAQTFAGDKTFNGKIIPAGATDYSTPQARKLASGTAAATTTNCPSGAWYGQHS